MLINYYNEQIFIIFHISDCRQGILLLNHTNQLAMSKKRKSYWQLMSHTMKNNDI